MFPEEQSFVDTGTRVAAASSRGSAQGWPRLHGGLSHESPSTHLVPQAAQKPAGQTRPRLAPESSDLSRRALSALILLAVGEGEQDAPAPSQIPAAPQPSRALEHQ